MDVRCDNNASVCGGEATMASSMEPPVQNGDLLLESYFSVRGEGTGKEFSLNVSNKGRRCLVRKGFNYRIDFQGKKSVSWRCSAKNCSAHLKTDVNLETILKDNDRPHNHTVDGRGGDKDLHLKLLLRYACKRRAKEDLNTSVLDIINDETNRRGRVKLSNEEFKHIYKAMCRQRRASVGNKHAKSLAVKTSNRTFDTNEKHSNSTVESVPQLNIPNVVNMEAVSCYTQQSFNPDEVGAQGTEPSLPLESSHLIAMPPQHLFHQVASTMQAHGSPAEQKLQGGFHNGEHWSSVHWPTNVDQSPSQQGLTNNSVQISNKSDNETWSSSDDDRYFKCYSDVRIHEDMLSDKVRTLAYRRSLHENKAKLCSATVLDLGAGTGILSHFASEAGAQKVFAVEASNIARYAQKVVEENKRESVITVMQTKIEDANLPCQVDAIVSEWMGYSLVYESMLSSVIWARDRYLKPNGLMFPSSASLFLAPVCDEELSARCDSWKDMKSLYGVSMDSMCELSKDAMTARAETKALEIESILANPCRLCHFDLYRTTLQEAKHIQSSFNFHCYGQSKVHAFATWFSVSFPGTVTLDTSPYALKTHWGQTVLYLKIPFQAKQDTNISGMFTMRPEHDHSSFNFHCYGQSKVHAFATWFSVSFPGTVTLDTSPYALKTHWGQTVLYLKIPFQAKQDTNISGMFTMRPEHDHSRQWMIEIEYQVNKRKKYKQQWRCAE